MRTFCVRSVLCTILAVSINAIAVLPAKAVVAGAPEFGRLFRIAKPGVPDSYVLGTLHVADPRVATLVPPLLDALASARTLAVEMIPAELDAQTLELEQLDGGERLEPLIGTAAYAQVRERLLTLPMQESAIERLKPWAAMMKVSRTTGAPGPTLDEEIARAARKGRLKMLPLEQLEEQISAFDAIPRLTQVALLQHALTQRDVLQSNAAATTHAWLRGDLDALFRIASNTDGRFPAMTRHYTVLIEHIIHGRTALMHHRLFVPLREGRVFVAIGAMHLQGRKGLLAMLRQDGYRVTRVW